MEKNNGVRFVRINGRIVPIKSKGANPMHEQKRKQAQAIQKVAIGGAALGAFSIAAPFAIGAGFKALAPRLARLTKAVAPRLAAAKQSIQAAYQKEKFYYDVSKGTGISRKKVKKTFTTIDKHLGKVFGRAK